MKPIASLLLALALHAAALSQATANDGTFKPQQAPGEPIKPRQTTNPDHSVPYKVNMQSSEFLPFDVNQTDMPDVHYPQATGFVPSIFEKGYIDTRKPNDAPVTKAWNPLVSTETMPFDPSNLPSVADLREWLAKILKDNTDGDAIRLTDLFLNPEFFAAAHAAGPEADALRGELDWLMLSGVILGLDGDDGLDDLRDGYIEQENVLHDGYIEQENVLHDGYIEQENALHDGYIEQENVLHDGYIEQENVLHDGFRTGTTLPSQAPAKNGIILGGLGSDNLQAPINGFVFGTRTFLKEPATDGFVFGTTTYLKEPAADGFIFGERTYLAGDSQDHNPDIAND